MALRGEGRVGRGGGGETATPRPVSGVITDLAPQQRSRDRFNVFLDGAYAFSLAAELAATLTVGRPLSTAEALALQERDQYHCAFEHALLFLAYRPRSEREVRDRLARHGYPAGTTDQVLVRLRELKLLDDEAFAQYWIEQRQAHAPRGALLLRQELLRKGTDREAVATALDEAELGEEAAYRAGEKKARQLRGCDEREFQRRLGAYLARRGFPWEIVTPVVRGLWRASAAES